LNVMASRSFLPSAQFVLVVISIALSGGLVIAAERFTRQENTARIESTQQPNNNTETSDWQRQLEEIQALSGIALPEVPDEEAYSALLEAAQSPNITESVSRSLLINLSNASAQGLGSDIPTQEQLVAQALQYLPQSTASYTSNDLVVVVGSKETFHAYGNAVMTTLQNYPAANAGEALRAVGLAIDQDDVTHFKKLAPIAEAYRAIARGLLAVPVPQTLSPLHLAIINNFSAMAAALADAEATPTDPLRGLVGLQRFELLLQESGRVFTTIAEQLNSSAILFTKDEPGNAWSVFLSALPQPST
jgi:hypothetical protein